jgi:hypothetical protein
VGLSARSENTPAPTSAQDSIYLSQPRLTSRDSTVDALQLHPGYDLQPFAPSSGQSPSSTPLPSQEDTTPSDKKRLNQDESAPPTKKAKSDTTPQRFTASSFQHMTREQLVDRLVVLENERMEQRNSKKVEPLSDDDIQGKKIDNKTEDDEDEDDEDDEEESESISSMTDTTVTATTPDTTEMRCLWKNCGETCVGVQGLTAHIVRTHVGGGKVRERGFALKRGFTHGVYTIASLLL